MSDERAEAIRIIEDSRSTHVEWIEYLAKFGDDLRPHEEIAGDTAHHREAVDGYDLVLRVLYRLVPSPPPGEPDDLTIPSDLAQAARDAHTQFAGEPDEGER